MDRLPGLDSWSARVFRNLVVACILAAGWLAPCGLSAGEIHAVVFLYHRFGEDAYPSTSTRLEQFDRHLEHLARNRYQVWPLERVVAHLKTRRPFPDDTVALTVDDAYLSVYTEAYPRLKARGWPFTVFVSTDAVDRRFEGFMSWDQMREMQAHGARFANHSATHDHLLRPRPGEEEAAWLARARTDIEGAQKRLQTELGEAPALFAYPYGEYSEPLADLVAQMGYTAFGQHSGALGPYSDLRALPRFPMAEAYAEAEEFAGKAAMRALPVQEYSPWDPVVVGTRRPALTLTLAGKGILTEELACYVSGQGRVPISWLDASQRRFVVQARADLPLGRSRYNCSAPDRDRRFYWFSQQWAIFDGP